jgi:hypothetical protein
VVPLDARPVTADLPADLARAAGAEVRVPPRDLLGDRRRPADVDRLWVWLDEQAPAADAVVASVEMLCFGGLVASRTTSAAVEDVEPRLRQVEDLAARVPMYACAVIPRTPLRPTDEDAAYWTTGDVAAATRHRRLHQAMHARLVAAASAGRVQYLLVGQDDTTPASPSTADRAALQAQVAALGASRVLLTTGADELAARLVARWLTDLTGTRPSVRVIYTFPAHVARIPRYEAAPLAQTVAEHVASVGGRLVEEEPDVVLWVHNFDGPQQEARAQSKEASVDGLAPLLAAVSDAARRGQVVALADVRYANGADRALVAHLLQEPQLAGVAAYAGWNTCSNSLGSALAQGVVAALVQGGVLAGARQILRRMLVDRLLDDWGYQADIRFRLAEALRRRGGDPDRLGGHRAWCEEQAQTMLSAAAAAVEPAFPQVRIVVRRVEFPWDRLFEVRIGADVLSPDQIAERAGREGS